jgi:hypothetical protein
MTPKPNPISLQLRSFEELLRNCGGVGQTPPLLSLYLYREERRSPHE